MNLGFIEIVCTFKAMSLYLCHSLSLPKEPYGHGIDTRGYNLILDANLILQ